MAENKKQGIDEDAAGPGVQSVTEATPAKADTTSNPIPNDAKPNDPPVRTNRPDVPIAQVLVAGAGAHEGRELSEREREDGTKVEVDADGFDRDGRFIADLK